MGTARQMAAAILGARPELGGGLSSKVTREVAWTLAVLIASWRLPAGGREPGEPGVDLRPYQDLAGAFERIGDSLIRFREAAGKARNAIDLAGASGLFLSISKTIGPETLAYVLESDRFAQIQRAVLSQYPIPGDLQAAALTATLGVPEDSRARRYLEFDYRSRGDGFSTVEPAAGRAAVNSEIQQWQQALRRSDLPPHQRWLFEQKLVGVGQFAYGSAEEARKIWLDAMTQSSTPELRQYFAQNIQQLRTREVQG